MPPLRDATAAMRALGVHDVQMVDYHEELPMIPEHRIPTHPGEVLREELLRPLELSQTSLAKHLGTSIQRINELVRGKRGVTPETAWALAGAFGTTPELWINLQTHHDLAKARPAKRVGRVRVA